MLRESTQYRVAEGRVYRPHPLHGNQSATLVVDTPLCWIWTCLHWLNCLHPLLIGQMVWQCSVTSWGQSSVRRTWISGWLWRDSRRHALSARWLPELRKSTMSSFVLVQEDRYLSVCLCLSVRLSLCPFNLSNVAALSPGQCGLICQRIDQSELASWH